MTQTCLSRSPRPVVSMRATLILNLFICPLELVVTPIGLNLNCAERDEKSRFRQVPWKCSLISPRLTGGARIEVSWKNPVFILVLGPNALTAYQLIRTCALIRQKSRIISTRHCALCSGTPDKNTGKQRLVRAAQKSVTSKSPVPHWQLCCHRQAYKHSN